MLYKFHQKTIYFEIIQTPLLNEIIFFAKFTYLKAEFHCFKKKEAEFHITKIFIHSLKLKELTDYFFLHICNKKNILWSLKNINY
jgi:hypothetical protein